MKRLPTIKFTPSEEDIKSNSKLLLENIDEHQILNSNTVIDEIYEESKRRVDRTLYKVVLYFQCCAIINNYSFH